MQWIFSNSDVSYFKTRRVSDFHPLELVGRGSETQIQVGEHFISYIYFALLGLKCILY